MVLSLFNLNYTGLQHEDLLNSSKPAIAEALELADPEVIKGRLRRLKRASDLTYKAKSLGDYAPNAKLDPFKIELWDDVKKIEARNDEYDIVNLHKK
jgi:ubiquinol-cytochrome c reductase subunit 7